MEVLIVGAGVGGLTLGLMLHEAGIPCRIYEAAPEIKPLGVGINLLPHAMRELSALGLEETLAAGGVATAEAVFFNRFGQLIYQEPLGRAAGYDWPQISIHRGDLQAALVEAFIARAGSDRLMLGWQCTKVEDGDGAAVAPHLETDLLPGRQGADEVDEVVFVADRHAVYLKDDVVGLQAGGRGRRVRVHGLDQRPLHAVQPQLQGVGRLEGAGQL